MRRAHSPHCEIIIKAESTSLSRALNMSSSSSPTVPAKTTLNATAGSESCLFSAEGRTLSRSHHEINNQTLVRNKFFSTRGKQECEVEGLREQDSSLVEFTCGLILNLFFSRELFCKQRQTHKLGLGSSNWMSGGFMVTNILRAARSCLTCTEGPTSDLNPDPSPP